MSYLSILFGISWPFAFLLFLSGLESHTMAWLCFAVYFMFTPTLAGIIATRLRRPRKHGIHFGLNINPNRWWMVALLAPGVLAVVATLISLAMPGANLTPELADTIALDKFLSHLPKETQEQLVASSANLPLHPFYLVLLAGTFSGALVNGIVALGEEIGWRGILLHALAPLGFWRASFAIGAIWGIWHLPFIVFGHNYPGHPLLGTATMVVWTVAFSPIIGYVTVKGRSVVAAAMMHGALNGTVMAPLLVLSSSGTSPLLVGTMGLAGIIVLLVINVILFALVGHVPEYRSYTASRVD